MKFKIFFYKGNYWINRLIAYVITLKQQRPPIYTHTGLIIDNKYMVDTDPYKKYNIRSWPGPAKDFDYIEIEVTTGQYQKLLEFVYKHHGDKYDFRECLRWLLGGILPDNKYRMNCVESITDVLNYMGLTNIDDDETFSIDELYSLIKELGIKC